MRSSSHNPWANACFHSEHPISVASKGTTFSAGRLPGDVGRPVNRRNYVSPASWVEAVERGHMSRTTSYLDYGLTTCYNEMWKGHIKNETTARLAALGLSRRDANNKYAKQQALVTRLARSRSTPVTSLQSLPPQHNEG